MIYITTHSTHFIYGYMASDILYRTTQIGRQETRCRHIGYSLRLAAMVVLYASSHRQDNTYHGLCISSFGALAGTRNIPMGLPWRIDPTTHRTMSERSYHGATSRSPGLYKDMELKYVCIIVSTFILHDANTVLMIYYCCYNLFPTIGKGLYNNDMFTVCVWCSVFVIVVTH